MKNHSTSERIVSGLIYIAIILLSMTFIYPFVYALAISFNDGMDSIKGGIYFFPRIFTINNYKFLFAKDYIFNSYVISISRTVLSIILAVIVNSLFAYSISKKYLKGRKLFNFLVIIPMYFSGGFLPFYLIMRQYGLINNFLIYILPNAVAPFLLILLRAYMSELPAEMEESAVMDGAGHLTVFTSIVLPLSMPVLAVVILMIGVGNWNDWFTGVVYMKDYKLYPCASLLYKMLKESTVTDDMMSEINNLKGETQVTPESLKMAMLIIMTAPIICIYPFLQKYFTQGLMIGAIKG